MPLITPSQTDGAELAPNSDTPQPANTQFAGARPSQPTVDPEPVGQVAATVPGRVETAMGSPWWRSRRVLTGFAAVVAIGALAVVGTSFIGSDSDDSDAGSDSDEPIRAVEATTGDLAEFVTVDGVLAYGAPVIYTAAVDGTVTRVVGADDVLDRGDIAYAINESPVVVMWGATPLYRPLESGVDDGADVEVLEANLFALGYTAEGELIVDEVFDEATTIAVEEFQEALGMPVDGTVAPSSVLLLNGPAVVSDVAAPLGSVVRATNPVLSLQLTDEITTVGMPVDDGLVTEVPNAGEQFSTGDVAFEYNTEPVIVVIGDVAFDRILSVGVDDGEDIELLEQTLVGLGFDADGQLEVDEHFDADTESAVAEWEDTLNLGDDGVLAPTSYVVLPADHSVIDVAVERGDRLDAGEAVFTVGVSTQTLTATIDGDDAGLISVGDSVDIDFADETISGTIVDIDDPVASPSDPDTETVDFEIALNNPPPESDSTSTDVEVQVVEQIASGVTLVPSSALISLGDGTYAVEEVRGNTTAFVAVIPGDFSDGMVEVEGIEPGTAVVVPS